MNQKFLFIPAGLCIAYILAVAVPWQNSDVTDTFEPAQNNSYKVQSTSNTSLQNNRSEVKNNSEDIETYKETGAENNSPEMPKLLNDTFIDGNYELDKNGNLFINKAIKYRFDYFLSAVSEVGIENCIKLIEEDIKNLLPDHAANEALKILNFKF